MNTGKKMNNEKPITFLGTGLDPQIQVTIKIGESASIEVVSKDQINGNTKSTRQT